MGDPEDRVRRQLEEWRRLRTGSAPGDDLLARLGFVVARPGGALALDEVIGAVRRGERVPPAAIRGLADRGLGLADRRNLVDELKQLMGEPPDST